ncbi:MAG TPA: NADH-quinone oxidoreductase subunit A [bacterium]
MIVDQYIPVIYLIVVALAIASIFTLAGILVGPKVRTPVKAMPFESGMMNTGSEYRRYSVRFYMVALAFLIFDVEIVFFYPWAVRFKQMGWYGFVVMMMFFVILLLGLVYDWKKGALEWE